MVGDGGGGGVGFLSAVAINMSSRRGPPSSQNRMTEGGLRREDGKKKAENEEWKGSEDKAKTNTAWTRPEIRAVRARARPALARKPNKSEDKRNIFVATSARFCNGIQPTQRGPVDPSYLREQAEEISRTIPASFIGRCITFIGPLMKRSI